MAAESQESNIPASHGEPSQRVLPVAEEQLQVGKRAVEAGRVRVHKTVHHRDQAVDLPLYTDVIDVQRVTVDRIVDVAPTAHYEGDVFVIPVVEEVLVKKLRIREEIRLLRRRREWHERQTHTLRYEDARVERLPAAPQTPPGGPDEIRPSPDEPK